MLQMLETLRIALGGLLANRLRSALTILGLAIGVASVIVLIAVGNGSAQTVQKSIESLGSNVLLVTQSFTLGGSGASNAAPKPLTQQDVDALNNKVFAPDVVSASPVVNAGSVTLVHNGVSYSPSSFVGTTPAYLTAHTYQIAAGENLTSADVAKRARVMVIGPTVVTNLFAGSDPIGQSVQANGVTYTVVGVTVSKGLKRRAGPGRRRVRADHRGAGHTHRLRQPRLDHDPGEVTRRAQRRPGRGDVGARSHSTTSPTPPPQTFASSTRARSWRRRARRATSSPPCSARSRRSRCWSVGSA